MTDPHIMYMSRMTLRSLDHHSFQDVFRLDFQGVKGGYCERLRADTRLAGM